MLGRNRFMKEHRRGRVHLVGARTAWAGCRAAAWLLGATVALSSAGARASEPTPEDRTTARELALEGHQALRSGNYALASDRFKRADALVHAPTLMLDLARSYIGLGQLVKAHETLLQIIREGVPAKSPPTWRKALDSAQKEAAALKPRLAWVTISTEGADNPRVKLDEEELTPASLGVRRAVDPGRRTVTVEAEGFLPATSSIDLREGETGEIHLALTRDPNYVPPTKAVVIAPRRVIVVEPPPPPQLTPAYVAFGVSGAGFLLSGVTTVLMLRTRSNLEPECQGKTCPADAEGDVSSYRAYGTLAAVGLGVGLAGAGVGTYFWLSRKRADDKQQLSVQALVAPGYVSLNGSF